MIDRLDDLTTGDTSDNERPGTYQVVNSSLTQVVTALIDTEGDNRGDPATGKKNINEFNEIKTRLSDICAQINSLSLEPGDTSRQAILQTIKEDLPKPQKSKTNGRW